MFPFFCATQGSPSGSSPSASLCTQAKIPPPFGLYCPVRLSLLYIWGLISNALIPVNHTDLFLPFSCPQLPSCFRGGGVSAWEAWPHPMVAPCHHSGLSSSVTSSEQHFLMALPDSQYFITSGGTCPSHILILLECKLLDRTDLV